MDEVHFTLNPAYIIAKVCYMHAGFSTKMINQNSFLIPNLQNSSITIHHYIVTLERFRSFTLNGKSSIL